MSDVNVASTDERSTRIREKLVDSGLYLGDRKILQHVECKANGRKESLFVKEAPPTPSSEEQKPLSEDIVADLVTICCSSQRQRLLANKRCRLAGANEHSPSGNDEKF
ncbi:hypothetical protein BU15DRAFT_59879 [Melanogaster broomeanus]|nr:hypothetical protein BU15DRAFT_59879 [Melanogaster broomeanus]